MVKKTMADLASETPWSHARQCGVIRVFDAEGQFVAEVEKKASAALIVRAVNFYVRRRVLIGVRKAQREKRT